MSATSYRPGGRNLMSDDTSGITSKIERRTDWRRLRSMTDEEIHAAIIDDPDARPTDEAFWKDARIVAPQRKETVTMRLDADLLEWFRRELCPVILGHSQEREKALTYQFGGQSNKGLPPAGQWRCLWLSEVSNVRLRERPWCVGDRHSQPQDCVEIVDLDVNPESPYNPKRRL